MRALLTKRIGLRVCAGVGILALAACATGTPDANGINDPREQQNRKVHAFNKQLDTAIVRPVAVAYSNAMPDDLENSVSNFASNLSLPGVVVNNILQGNIEGAFTNTVRFVVNSTLGFGGIHDPASDFGIAEVDADFGQTLYVWGVGEGHYLDSPVFGPGTQRRLAGRIVDFVIDPVGYVVPSPEKYYGTGAKVISGVGARGRFAGTIDSVLYDSADSYAQARLIYLQTRRFELGYGAGSAGSNAASDPYFDPYEDPYAQ